MRRARQSQIICRKTTSALSHRRLYSSHKQTTGVGRMKFLQLLGKELNEWPPKADWSVCVIETRGEAKASFGCGDKPKPDPIDRKFHTWTICEPGTNADWLGVHRVLSEKASDQLTAVVTRADWEAERAKLKAPKANGSGWIRHRGGKCPVEAGTLVDVRYRSGVICEGVTALIYHGDDGFESSRSGYLDLAVDWSHTKSDGDIMRYKIHKPAEQPEINPAVVKNVEAFNDQAELRHDPCADGPLQWRDRIHELDTQSAEVESVYQLQISEITQERESLVQKLAGEGLALVEVVVQPVENMSDWRNWKAGDLLECVSVRNKHCASLTLGKLYRYKGQGCVLDDDGDEQAYPVKRGECFKLHSRPAS